MNLAGEFNGWDPGAIPMTDVDGNGAWEIVIELDSGRTYQYKYVLNGGVKWEPDPLNPSAWTTITAAATASSQSREDGQIVLGAARGAPPAAARARRRQPCRRWASRSRSPSSGTSTSRST